MKYMNFPRRRRFASSLVSPRTICVRVFSCRDGVSAQDARRRVFVIRETREHRDSRTQRLAGSVEKERFEEESGMSEEN